MRVLYVSHFGGLGGAERSLLELMDAVRTQGIDPVLLCPSGPLSEAAATAGIPVANWAAHPITRSRGHNSWKFALPRLPLGWRELDRTVRRFQPHLLHANSAQAMLWIGPVASWRRCPLVWHWRDFYGARRVARTMAGRADAIVAISEATLTCAEEMLGPTSRRLTLIRNGVADLPPRDADRVAAVRRGLDIPATARLVVMAGQSVPRKGHAVLLEALAILTRTHPDLHAWLLCPEHDRQAATHTRQLRRLAVDLGCGPRVRITEGVEQIAPALYAADVVAVPSLREPFGRIAVEAMLAQRPVVASSVDGLKEIVTEDETGLLVPPGDPACLAAGLARILDEPASWATRATAARREALQLFSISRVASELVPVYGGICRN
ncbi:MAG TPA: glycosyltransferase family 4 protein [Pyrinomonadaceae bacterium]|nr:glycosyltransferase family 4 protein [Pyrinomonadaceae bacterium]